MRLTFLDGAETNRQLAEVLLDDKDKGGHEIIQKQTRKALTISYTWQ